MVTEQRLKTFKVPRLELHEQLQFSIMALFCGGFLLINWCLVEHALLTG